MLDIKKISKLILSKLGYEVRLKKRHYIDPFNDQKEILKNKNVENILDVGANIGQSVSIYRNLFPNAKIFSFEPTEKEFNILLERCKNANLVYPYKIAISNINGKKVFYSNKESLTNSLLRTTEKAGNYLYNAWRENLETIQVESVTIDKFCSSNQIDEVSILKMDIQGGEFMALKGAINMLNKQAVDLIYTEVLFGNAYEGQGYFHDLCNLLTNHNYTLYGIYNLVRAFNGTLYQGDAIFISPKIEARLNPNWVKNGIIVQLSN